MKGEEVIVSESIATEKAVKQTPKSTVLEDVHEAAEGKTTKKPNMVDEVEKAAKKTEDVVEKTAKKTE